MKHTWGLKFHYGYELFSDIKIFKNIGRSQKIGESGDENLKHNIFVTWTYQNQIFYFCICSHVLVTQQKNKHH